MKLNAGIISVVCEILVPCFCHGDVKFYSQYILHESRGKNLLQSRYSLRTESFFKNCFQLLTKILRIV